jgi:preprotein translocase subunit SecA
MLESHPDPTGSGGIRGAEVAEMEPFTITVGAAPVVDPNNPATWVNTPRNAPCPCGSGNKYKHCHGRMG